MNLVNLYDGENTDVFCVILLLGGGGGGQYSNIVTCGIYTGGSVHIGWLG